MAAAGSDVADEVDEKIIQEEFRVWKKNAPMLYDVVISHALDWPSLTCQWLPQRNPGGNPEYAEHKMILGTHTSDSEPNYLMVATVRLPTDEAEIDASKYDEEKGELGGYGCAGAKFEISVRLNHDHEVNRARYCPQNPFLIGTKSPSGDVLVFDYSKHPSKPVDDKVKPLVRLTGHSAEGYGLAWSPHTQGLLLSAGDDHLVNLYDIERGPVDATPLPAGSRLVPGRTLGPLKSYKLHTDVVEDVAWHRFNKDTFGSVGDDHHLIIYDAREAVTKPVHRLIAHADANVMSLAFNPFRENLVLTGATDKTVRLWDLRALKADTPLHTFEGHADEVLSVSWSPFHEWVFASSGGDRRVNVWDCSKIGAEQSEEEAEDGPPELMFVHGGHTSKISDFSWCETEAWFLASVAEDNVVQVWQMAENLYAEAEEEEDGEEEEEEEEVEEVKPKAGKGSKKSAAPADEELE